MYDFGEHEDAAYGAPYGIALGDAWDDDEYGVVLTAAAISALVSSPASIAAAGTALTGIGLGQIILHGGPKHLQALATRKRRLKAKLKKSKRRGQKRRLKRRIKRINRAYKRLKARLKKRIARRKSKGKKLTKRQQRSWAIVQRERRRRKRARRRKQGKPTLVTEAAAARRKVRRAKKMRAYDLRAWTTYVNSRRGGLATGHVRNKPSPHSVAFANAVRVFPDFYKRRGGAKLAARIAKTGPHTFQPVAQIGPSPYKPSPYTPAYTPPEPWETPARGGIRRGTHPLPMASGAFQFPPGSVSAQEYGPGGGQYEEEEGFSEEAEVGPEEDEYSDEGMDDYGEETPFWKNPLFLGGAAVVAFLGYQQMQKGKKKSASSSPKKKKRKAPASDFGAM